MTYALQLAVAGIAVGSVYALIALGIVLIYKCSGVVNFAQGAYAMVGAYVTYFLVTAAYRQSSAWSSAWPSGRGLAPSLKGPSCVLCSRRQS
jgi:branched-subunit amino acid ABC-type transport system permease component